jgi:hypothetical protein
LNDIGWLSYETIKILFTTKEDKQLRGWGVVTRQLLELFIEEKEPVAAHLIPLDGRGLSLPESFQPAKQHV